MDKPEATKMVKIKAKSAIRLNAVEGVRKDEVIIQPGAVIEVTEAEAEEFTKELTQHHNFSGQRTGIDAEQRLKVVRAELVK